MNIGPQPWLIEALRSQNLGWKTTLAELFDNSIEHGAATQITATFDKKTFIFMDNGHGCKDLRAMFSMGDHRPRAKGTVARFGFGFKEAALWLYGTTTVESVCGGILRSARVTWDRVKKSGSWDVEDPIETPAPNRVQGLTATFSDLQKNLPTLLELERYIEELAFMYAPAIRAGVQLLFRAHGREIIAPRFEFPRLDDVIQGSIKVSGKGVDIHVGIVREGERNRRSGFSYWYRHRIIHSGTGLGCGQYSPSRIFGAVKLASEDWKFTKNKDDIRDHKEELGAAVESFCRPVLEKAHRQAQRFVTEHFQTRLTELFRAGLEPRKPGEKEKRRKDQGQGTHSRPDLDIERIPRKRQPGGVVPPRISATGFRIEFEDLDESDGLGRVDIEGSRVILAAGHPTIEYFRLKSDQTAGLLGTLAIATGLFVNYVVFAVPELKERVLPGMKDDPGIAAYAKAMSRALGRAALKELGLPSVWEEQPAR